MKLPCCAFVLLGLLAGCSNDSAVEQTADRLDNAAEQSDPAAAAVLRNEAEAVRDNGVVQGGPSQEEGTVQRAMENAGAAQVNSTE